MTIREVFENFGLEVTRELQKNIDTRGINASRRLRQSIDYRVFNLGGDTRFFLGFLNDAEGYAYFTDKGRAAGKMPPLAPIEKWITDKGIDLRKDLPKGSKVNILKRRRSVAFLMARKIGQKGTKPTNFWSDVVTPELFIGLKKDLAKAAKDQIKFDFKLK